MIFLANDVLLEADFPRPKAFQTTPVAIVSDPMFAALGPDFPRKFADQAIIFDAILETRSVRT